MVEKSVHVVHHGAKLVRLPPAREDVVPQRVAEQVFSGTVVVIVPPGYEQFVPVAKIAVQASDGIVEAGDGAVAGGVKIVQPVAGACHVRQRIEP